MIIPANIAAASAMDGFKNYLASSFSVNVPAQTLGVGGFVSYTATTPLNNTNSISQTQVQYSGLSSDYYVVNGSILTSWDSGNLEVQTYYYFDSMNLNVFTVLINQSGGSYSLPSINISCRGFLFIAPF